MSPADELVAAAERLEKLAGEATEGPWVSDGHTYELEDASGWDVDGPSGGYVARLADKQDADYIAAMDPRKGRKLATALRNDAERITDSTDPRFVQAVYRGNQDLIDLARLING